MHPAAHRLPGHSQLLDHLQAVTQDVDSLAGILNATAPLFSIMIDVVNKHHGIINKFLGDGFMAVFGAPIEADDHADRALRAAREMLRERLPRFNRWLKENGFRDRFRMGIGLSSGPLMSGTVGSSRRLEYAAVGDTTNTAARLESMTKRTPHSILISESTRRLLRQPSDDLVSVGEVDVRGKRSKISVWTLAEDARRSH